MFQLLRVLGLRTYFESIVFMVLVLSDLSLFQLFSSLFDLEPEMMEQLCPFGEVMPTASRKQGSTSPGGTSANDLDYLLPRTEVSMDLFRCLRITDPHSANKFN